MLNNKIDQLEQESFKHFSITLHKREIDVFRKESVLKNQIKYLYQQFTQINADNIKLKQAMSGNDSDPDSSGKIH